MRLPGSAPEALIGALNGALVAYGGLPSFLVTLATMGVFAGVAPRMTNLAVGADRERRLQRAVRRRLAVRRSFADALDGRSDRRRLFRLSRDAASARISTQSATAREPRGRLASRCCACASACSCSAARWRRWPAFSMPAGCTARATRSAKADLLTVIAAVIVGGTRLNGGAGSIVGALIGSLLMGMLNNGLILMGFQPSDQMIARGLIILIAVALTLREPDR